MPRTAAEREAAEGVIAYQRWVDHFQGSLPYLESLTLDRREAHCVGEIIRVAFAAGWEAAKAANADLPS